MFGDYLDIDEDTDDMLIMNVSSLHNASVPRPSRGIKGCDKSWLNSNIPQDMVKILSKYKDKKWLNHSQHSYCIFYACDIIGGLCGLSKEACIKILSEPTLIDSLLCLWRGDLTWFEQRAAARTLSTIFQTAPCVIPKFVKNRYNINICKLAMKQYTECVQYVVKRCMVNTDCWEYKEGYVQDLVVKVKGHMMQYDVQTVMKCTKHCAQDWMQYNGSVFLHLARYSQQYKHMIELFESVFSDIIMFEKACAMDLCYLFFNENPDRDPDTIMDSVISLTKNERMCQLISKSENIIKALILKLRSPSSLHLRYDLIILNLLKNNCIPQKYYYDLCISLMVLLDVDKTYKHIKCFDIYDNYHLFESVVDSLKLLFNISLQIEFMASKKTIKRFKCRACSKLVRFPQKIPCGHVYCYLCVIHKLKYDAENAKCLVDKCKNKNFIFTAKEEKLNFKILHEMNGSQIRAIVNTKSNDDNVFVGPLNEYWSFIKHNLDKTMINDWNLNEEFEYFCDFMSKETSITTCKNSKQCRIKGRNKRIDGNALFKKKQYEEAIICYVEALKLCPNKYKQDRILYFSNLAIAYFKTNQIFKSYKAALSGLVINSYQVKLGNILSECHSKLKITELTKNIIDKETFDVFNDGLFVNKVQNVVFFEFYTSFKSGYFSTKNKHRNEEFKHMTSTEAEKAVVELLEMQKKDPFTQSIDDKQNESLKRDIHFVRMYYEKYCDEYSNFTQDRKRAKKEIYAFLIYILSHKTEFWVYDNDDDLETEEFIAIDDMLEVVNDHFGLEKKLHNIGLLKQNVLITSFIAKKCLGFKESKIDQIPQVIAELVQSLIFTKMKYNIYNVDADCIRKIVKKSTHLTLSEHPVYDDAYSTGDYGVKLTDLDKTCDDKWQEQDFSDNDSGIDEFRSKLF